MNWDNTDWLVLFTASWILFFLLADFKSLGINIWGGVFALLLQLLMDSIAISHDWYEIKKMLLPHLFGSAPLFCFGPVIAMGVLIAQYHPARRELAVLHIFVNAFFYSFQEYLLVLRGDVKYVDWHYFDSIFINLLAMMTISWFAVFILNKRKVN